jgi:pilus assembly protein CpaF
MTVQFSQATLADALPQVLSIARQIDAEGLSASERANVAITYVIEKSGLMWPMAFQREILEAATVALQPAPNPTPPTPPPPPGPRAAACHDKARCDR